MIQILWLPYVNYSLLATLSIAWFIVLCCSIPYRKIRPLTWILSGLIYALIFCQFQLHEQVQTPSNKDLVVLVKSLPKSSSNKTSFIGTDTTTGKTYLLNQYHHTTDALMTFKAGNIYHLNANLKPPHGSVNGVGFDREKWLFRNGIDGIGSIKKIHPDSRASFEFISLVNRWRTALSQLINQSFKNPQSNALIHALSIGDKSHFEHHDMTMFQNTGTAHLIAISGLHVGMVAYLGWLLGSLFFKMWPQQQVARPVFQIITGLILAGLYACLAGLAVSTLRALIMLTVYGVYKLSRRSSYGWDVWSVSLMIVLLLDPLNVLDGGFWLSFTAVAVLILAFNGTTSQQQPLTNFFTMQWTLLIGMLPLSLTVFSKINLMTPIVNLIMIPLMTFLLIPLILLLIVIGSLVGAFPDSLVSLIDWISLCTLAILAWFDQFSSWALNLSIHYWWQYIVLILAAALLVLPRVIPQRVLGISLLVVGLYTPQEKIPNGHFNAHILDVGQGLSVVIETQNHTAIYDVGAAYDSGFNMVDAVILPFLHQRNINSIDTLILSHQDNDHSGAAIYLQQQIPIIQTLGTEPTHQACITGNSWQWDQVKFTFLSPNNLTPYLKNNSSCVLKIESAKASFLLTGDIENPVEYRLTRFNSEQIQADVMLVPHHGSKTSSTIEFIKAVNPQTAINSSGQFNPFKHPAETIKKRYQTLGIPMLDTQSSGLISLTTFPELGMTSLRELSPQIWRKKKPD